VGPELSSGAIGCGRGRRGRSGRPVDGEIEGSGEAGPIDDGESLALQEWQIAGDVLHIDIARTQQKDVIGAGNHDDGPAGGKESAGWHGGRTAIGRRGTCFPPLPSSGILPSNRPPGSYPKTGVMSGLATTRSRWMKIGQRRI
jgi:hypothetical protein